MERVVTLARVALATVLAVAATACLPPPTEPTGDGPLVAIVGDSLTWAAENGPGWPDDPDESFLVPMVVDAGYSVTFTARLGINTGHLAPVEWPGDPDVLVVALGTNDLHAGAEGQITAEQAAANVAAHAAGHPDACLVLVTVAETPAWGLDVTAPPYNALLSANADVVAPWHTVVAANPGYLLDQSPGDDGDPHHTETGRAAYRDLIVDAVEACPT